MFRTLADTTYPIMMPMLPTPGAAFSKRRRSKKGTKKMEINLGKLLKKLGIKVKGRKRRSTRRRSSAFGSGCGCNAGKETISSSFGRKCRKHSRVGMKRSGIRNASLKRSGIRSVRFGTSRASRSVSFGKKRKLSELDSLIRKLKKHSKARSKARATIYKNYSKRKDYKSKSI